MLERLNDGGVTFLIQEGYEIYTCVLLNGECYFEFPCIRKKLVIADFTNVLINKII